MVDSIDVCVCDDRFNSLPCVYLLVVFQWGWIDQEVGALIIRSIDCPDIYMCDGMTDSIMKIISDLEHVEELEGLHLEAEGAVHHQQHQVRHLGCCGLGIG